MVCEQLPMLKLLQEDIIKAISEGQKSFGFLQGAGVKILYLFFLQKLPPLCSPSPLGEAEGGRSGGQKLLSPFGPTNDFILWKWQLFQICLQRDFSIYQHHLLEKLSSSDSSKIKDRCNCYTRANIVSYDIQMSNHVMIPLTPRLTP